MGCKDLLSIDFLGGMKFASRSGRTEEAFMKPMHCVTLLSGLVLAALSGVAWAGDLEPPPSVAPEPTTLSLLAAGIGGLAWAKFRRRK